jgi:DNA-binding winged helix-turn-helix (wHTH) protein/pimeloyl-ACP methyl ester carboxylesterase
MRVFFGPYTLDSGLRELHDGSAVVPVEPQVFDLIEFLIRNRDKVVSRDDLIENVWNGRIVSESTLATRINAARKAIGDDGAAQKLIKTVARKGFRFVGDISENGAASASSRAAAGTPAQKVIFCRTSDNVNIAVATVGEGPALLKTANWLNHLENDWHSPIWSPMLKRLASGFEVSRYDGRGTGLSDRDVTDISLPAFERDLEAVVEKLALRKFSLIGMSQGASTAIVHAVKHPERVSKLILYGAYAQGRNRRASPDEAVTAQTVLAMMRAGWGQEDSAFMRAFSSLYLPNGTREQIREFADLQRASTSAELAVRLRVACDDIDVVEYLPRVTVPTLVLHARRDQVVPVEEGRSIAAKIPGARFVTLESENHVPLPGEPAWEQLLSEIEAFAA